MNQKTMPASLFHFLWAPLCKSCACALHTQKLFCNSCWRQILLSMRGQQLGYLFCYNQESKYLLRALRSAHSLPIVGLFVRFLQRKKFLSQWQSANYDLLVWAPTAKQYAGIQLFGRRIADELGVEWESELFEKYSHFEQHGRNQKERMDTEGMARVKAHKVPCVKGKRVLLLDDVTTTGTTLQFAAYLMRKEGAISVDTFALARQESKKLRFPLESSTASTG